MEDENEIRNKKAAFSLGMDLSEFSVDELHELAGFLKEEVTRLEEAARAKSDHLSAAEALFKS